MIVNVGDRVWWNYTPRGGYGYGYLVDALVLKVRGERVQIQVTHRREGFVCRWVFVSSLRAKDAPAS